MKFKNITIQTQKTNAKYLNIVLVNFQLSKAFFRNDNDAESKAADITHNAIANI